MFLKTSTTFLASTIQLTRSNMTYVRNSAAGRVNKLVSSFPPFLAPLPITSRFQLHYPWNNKQCETYVAEIFVHMPVTPHSTDWVSYFLQALACRDAVLSFQMCPPVLTSSLQHRKTELQDPRWTWARVQRDTSIGINEIYARTVEIRFAKMNSKKEYRIRETILMSA